MINSNYNKAIGLILIAVIFLSCNGSEDVHVDMTDKSIITVYGRPFHDYRIAALELGTDSLPGKKYFVKLRLDAGAENESEIFDAWSKAFDTVIRRHFNQYHLDFVIGKPVASYIRTIQPGPNKTSIFIFHTNIEKVRKDRDKWIRVVHETNMLFRLNTTKLAKLQDEAKQVFNSE